MHSVEHNNLCLKLARRPVSSKNITAHYTNFDVLFAKKHVASRCISVQETESRGKHVKTVSMSNYLSHSRSKPPNSNQSKINLNFSFWCGCYSTGLAGGGGGGWWYTSIPEKNQPIPKIQPNIPKILPRYTLYLKFKGSDIPNTRI